MLGKCADQFICLQSSGVVLVGPWELQDRRQVVERNVGQALPALHVIEPEPPSPCIPVLPDVQASGEAVRGDLPMADEITIRHCVLHKSYGSIYSPSVRRYSKSGRLKGT